MKILPAEAQLIHADRPTVGRTHWWTDGQYWQKQYWLSASLESAYIYILFSEILITFLRTRLYHTL